MMTWGEIEGTPFRLDASDMTLGDGGPMFKVQFYRHHPLCLSTLFRFLMCPIATS
jgi:hypothetical protein